MWNKCSKDEYGMTVNQERDCDGKAKNGINLGRAIPQTHLTLKKSAGAGLWPPARRDIYLPSMAGSGST